MKISHLETRSYKGVPITSYADEIDEGSMEQLLYCAELPGVQKIFVMPDVHKGYTAPIGSVIYTKDTVIPELLGNDIGCGISSLDLNFKNATDEDLKRIYTLISDTTYLPKKTRQSITPINMIPSVESFVHMVTNLIYDDFISAGLTPDVIDKEKIRNVLGTLGDGNHFVEICELEEPATNIRSLYSVVHTGSRSIGSTTLKVVNNIIENMKSNNDEIVKALSPFNMQSNTPVISQSGADADLVQKIVEFLNNRSTSFDQVFKLIKITQKMAMYNRMIVQATIYHAVHQTDCGLNLSLIFDSGNYIECEHNTLSVDGDYFVHKKGAATFNDQGLAVIAGSQTDGSYIVRKTDTNEINSCSHGAGRKMSRTQARNTLNVDEELEKLTKAVPYNSFNSVKSLEECSAAYKNIDAVLSLQSELVEPIKKLTPVINIKG